MRKALLAALFLALAAAFPPALPAQGGEAASEGFRREELPLPGGGLRELEYRGRDLVEERLVDGSGALIEESLFEAGSAIPYEKRAYLRSGMGRLLRVEARDAAGALLGSMDYRYDRDGRLLGVAASGSLGEESAGMLSASGAPQGSWTSGSGTTTVLAYDERGRQVARKTLREGKPVSVERRSYGDGSLPVRIETEDLASGGLSVVDYDEKGRSRRMVVSASGRETARTDYSYDAEGRLAEEAIRYPSGGFTTRRLSYLADGSLAREETRRDGVIVGAVEYIEGGRIEELYRGGELFVKATYLAGRKVKDEFFADGAPIRGKEYE